MSNPLSEAVIANVRAFGAETWSVSGFRHSRPQPLPSKGKTHPDVEQQISYTLSILPSDLTTRIDNYVHSSEVTDIELVSKGYTVLAEKPPTVTDEDVLFEMFVRTALDFPIVEGDLIRYSVPALTPEVLIDQVQTQSSSGLLRLDSTFGVPAGTKEQMHHGAVAVNRQDLEGDYVPASLPYKPAGKGEVIKKGKKVRTIQLESQANYQILKHWFEPLVSTWLDPASGVAIGMSTRNGDFKQILMSWYDIVREDEGWDWYDFLDWLEQQPIHESDKTAWEASTNELDGFNFVMKTICQVERVQGRSAEVLARALGDYINPPILVDRDVVYSVPWRVASGSYFTAYGNSHRHKSMVNWICDFLEMHDNAYGALDCNCHVCLKFGDIEGWGTRVSSTEVKLLRAAYVLGDDFIAINRHPYLFDRLMDGVFGTTTKTELKPFFSSPGLQEPEGAEFLRRYFVRIENNVFTFREAGRVLAKLFKGTSTVNRERFYAACLSALFDCGANEPLYRIIYDLLHVENLDMANVEKELEKYVRRHPDINSLSDGFVPSYADLLEMDASVLTPLYRYRASKIARQFGLTPKQFEHEVEFLEL